VLLHRQTSHRPCKHLSIRYELAIILFGHVSCSQNSLPHMLLHGPPGTGKTTTIMACARQMYGARVNQMTLELNASDARGIDVARDQIKSFVSMRHLFAQHQPKLVILDEADNMTQATQFALRRIIEQYASNARFCLICNYSSQIIPALQSRCTKFRFGPLSSAAVETRVREIAQAENVNVTDDGIQAILKLGKGDMRRILNVLQSASLTFPVVDSRAVHLTTGDPLPQDMEYLVKTLLSRRFQECVIEVEKMRSERGYSLVDLVREMHDGVKRIEMPRKARIILHSDLADIEHRLCVGCFDRMHVPALVGSFIEAREAIVRVATQ
jgi:replication factor C subunit 3/5